MSNPSLPGPVLGRLDEQDCQTLHDATLRVLERTGVLVQEPQALALLARAGAMVDGDLVRLPERLVQWGLDRVPKSAVLYDRDGREAIRLQGRRVSFGPGSDCLMCHDHRTGRRRPAVLQDVRDTASVVDALPGLDFAMSLFTPSDVTAELCDRYQLQAMLEHTTKPIVYVTFDDDQAHLDASAMGALVAGGERALSARPFLACYKNTLFPLVHNRSAVRTLIDLSAMGLPCIYSPVSTAGTVAPMTVAGATVVVNAGVLLGVVLSQLVREGASYIAIGWAGEALDMRTLVDVFSWPDHRCVYSSLLHWYGLPIWALGGTTEAKVPDQQAAAELALTLMADAVAGNHMVHDIGFMDAADCGALTQLVLADDVVGWLRHFLAPVDLSDEALALDVIEEVGPGGLFLKHRHTRRHARERFAPRLFDRRSHRDWLVDGGRDALARAAERVEAILREHRPEPLPDDVRTAVSGVVEAAERRLAATR